MTAKFSIRRIRFKGPSEWGPITYIVLAMACAAAYPLVSQQTPVPLTPELRTIENAGWVLTRHGKRSGVTFFDKTGHAKGSWFLPHEQFNRDVSVFAHIDNLPSSASSAKISVDGRMGAEGGGKIWRAEIGGREVYSWQRAVEIHETSLQVARRGIWVSAGLMMLFLLSMLKFKPVTPSPASTGSQR